LYGIAILTIFNFKNLCNLSKYKFFKLPEGICLYLEHNGAEGIDLLMAYLFKYTLC